MEQLRQPQAGLLNIPMKGHNSIDQSPNMEQFDLNWQNKPLKYLQAESALYRLSQNIEDAIAYHISNGMEKQEATLAGLERICS